MEYQHLANWMVDNKVQFSSSLRIADSQLGGIGVFAAKDLDPDTVIYSISKAHVLSPATCGIADLLYEAQIDGMVGLAIAYMFERSQGSVSPWYEFLETIQTPDPIPLPRLWSKEDQELLQGTQVERMGGLDNEELQDAYTNVVEPFVNKHDNFFSPKYKTYDGYTGAVYDVCTRAFEVDNYRQLSLVPGACLFNHSDKEHVHFETDGQVCELCGDLYCEHLMEEEENGNDSEDDNADYVDETNSNDRPIDAYDTPPLIDNNLIQQVLEEDYESDDENDDCCQMTLIHAVRKGQEIFNTYGDYSNGQLLSRYGFAIWDNQHETIDLGLEIVQYAKAHDMKSRLKWWSKNFYQCIFGLDPAMYDKFVSQLEEEEHEEKELPPPPDEIDWKDTVDILSSGEPSEGLELACKLLNLSSKRYLALQVQAKKYGHYSILENNTSSPAKIIKWAIHKRLACYNDAKLKSNDYAQLIKADISYNKKMALTVLGTEKLVLERCLNRI